MRKIGGTSSSFRLATSNSWRAAAQSSRAANTAFVLNGVTEESARPDQLSEANLIRGQLQLGLGQNEKALETFSQVAKAQIRPTWPWARFAYTNGRLELGDLSTAEAIEELEGLRHAWCLRALFPPLSIGT